MRCSPSPPFDALHLSLGLTLVVDATGGRDGRPRLLDHLEAARQQIDQRDAGDRSGPQRPEPEMHLEFVAQRDIGDRLPVLVGVFPEHFEVS